MKTRAFVVTNLKGSFNFGKYLGRVRGWLLSDTLFRIGYKLFVFGATAPPPERDRNCSCTRFLDHTQRRTIVGRTPLDE